MASTLLAGRPWSRLKITITTPTRKTRDQAEGLPPRCGQCAPSRPEGRFLCGFSPGSLPCSWIMLLSFLIGRAPAPVPAAAAFPPAGPAGKGRTAAHVSTSLAGPSGLAGLHGRVSRMVGDQGRRGRPVRPALRWQHALFLPGKVAACGLSRRDGPKTGSGAGSCPAPDHVVDHDDRNSTRNPTTPYCRPRSWA